jgi:hypothetical protein
VKYALLPAKFNVFRSQELHLLFYSAGDGITDQPKIRRRLSKRMCATAASKWNRTSAPVASFASRKLIATILLSIVPFWFFYPPPQFHHGAFPRHAQHVLDAAVLSQRQFKSVEPSNVGDFQKKATHMVIW